MRIAAAAAVCLSTFLGVCAHAHASSGAPAAACSSASGPFCTAVNGLSAQQFQPDVAAFSPPRAAAPAQAAGNIVNVLGELMADAVEQLNVKLATLSKRIAQVIPGPLPARQVSQSR